MIFELFSTMFGHCLSSAEKDGRRLKTTKKYTSTPKNTPNTPPTIPQQPQTTHQQPQKITKKIRKLTKGAPLKGRRRRRSHAPGTWQEDAPDSYSSTLLRTVESTTRNARGVWRCLQPIILSVFGTICCENNLKNSENLQKEPPSKRPKT